MLVTECMAMKRQQCRVTGKFLEFKSDEYTSYGMMIPCCKGKVYPPLPNQGSRKVSIDLVVVDNIDVKR